MSNHPEYDREFFEAIVQGSLSSAHVIVPLVMELIKPKSVVDVGCGIGTFLSVFQEHGIEDYLGIDGDYVDRSMLQIPQVNFLPHDLTKPLSINQKFDLVISLEVAEHIPAEYAVQFVEDLIKLGDVILFSAAIPHQGGVGHINEQWPQYWAKIFNNNKYLTIDCIRKNIWGKASVEPWYAQNLLFFVQEGCLQNYPSLAVNINNDTPAQLAIVHPAIYSYKLQMMAQVLEKQHQSNLELIDLALSSLKLRDINLIIFPSWENYSETIQEELECIIKTIAIHPGCGQITLLISCGDISVEDISAMVNSIVIELILEGEIDANNKLSLSFVGEMIEIQWERLFERIHAKLILSQESSLPFTILLANKIESYSITSLNQKQVVQLDDGSWRLQNAGN